MPRTARKITIQLLTCQCCKYIANIHKFCSHSKHLEICIACIVIDRLQVHLYYILEINRVQYLHCSSDFEFFVCNIIINHIKNIIYK